MIPRYAEYDGVSYYCVISVISLFLLLSLIPSTFSVLGIFVYPKTTRWAGGSKKPMAISKKPCYNY